MLGLPTLMEGDTGVSVARAQGLLRACAPGSRDDSLSIDGQFGPLTAAAVRTFQARAGLPIDGLVDEPTWRSLLGL
jgi:peptidoglycan hydrolase-like protein with peptidoglycan-binding domain